MGITVNNARAFLDVDNLFMLNSEKMAKSIYNRRKEILICPKNSSFITLSLLLNKLNFFEVDAKNSCRLQKNTFDQEYFFMKFFNQFEDGTIHFIIINIVKSKSQIVAKANKSYIDT